MTAFASREIHSIPPVFDANSRILVLGSFPSVASREGAFFYHHPQNRFWRVLAAVLQTDVPVTIQDKRAMLLSHRIALWDVIASCDIQSSSDSSIRNVLPNDLSLIRNAADIQQIYTNGAAAFTLYQRFCLPQTHREAVKLPSTSPANAAYSLERLIEEWKVIRQ